MKCLFERSYEVSKKITNLERLDWSNKKNRIYDGLRGAEQAKIKLWREMCGILPKKKIYEFICHGDIDHLPAKSRKLARAWAKQRCIHSAFKELYRNCKE